MVPCVAKPAYVAGPDLALDEFANEAARARNEKSASIFDAVQDRPTVLDEYSDDYHTHLKDMSVEKITERYH